jgi:dTDP-4-amino-4,6-dideoxygalactose transaminase
VIRIRQSDPGSFVRHHRSDLLAALERVLDSGWYILGAEVDAFEREFARHFDLRHAIGVANGTDALAIALAALGVARGARVATVSHTAVATVAAIEMAGAVPVFVDIDDLSYTLDPQALAPLVDGSEPLAAIIAVHLYGHPADMPRIRQLAERAGVPLIEDCAQAHGAKIAGHYVGAMGDAAAFSFYPTKNLGALGDGGMVATADEAVAARIRMLREYGWKERYVSEVPGVNSRLDELQAALLRVRLRFLEADNRRRAAIAAAYGVGLARTGLKLPQCRSGVTHVYHQYVVRSADRDGLRSRLAARGIGTNIHYPVPVHAQPAYRDRGRAGPAGLAVTERVAREVLSLPMYAELEDAQVEEIVQAVRQAV